MNPRMNESKGTRSSYYEQLQIQVQQLTRELAIAQMRLAYQQKLIEAHEVEQECIRLYGVECHQQQ